MADHVFGNRHRLDQLAEVIAGLDAHFMAQVDKVFGGHMAGRAAVARVRAATHAAQAGVELAGAKLQCLVVAGNGGAALVVQMHVKVGDLRPALADGQQGLAHLMRQVPAHRLEKGDAGDGDAGVVPLVDHHREHVHALRQRVGPAEVGAEGIADANRRLGRTGGFGCGNRGIEGLDLLGLRAVVVAPGEGIAHLDRGAGQVGALAHIELGEVFVGAVIAGLVEDRRGIADAGLGHEALGNLVDAGHLRRPLGMRKRADRDHLGAGLAERIEQTQLGFDRDRGALDLQTLAHGVVGNGHGFGQLAHGGLTRWGQSPGVVRG